MDEVNSLLVSHLLFADNALIFYNADLVQLEYLRHVFMWFQAVSGLRANLHKSEMVLVGDVPNLEELVAVLGCKLATLPMTYLGLPLGAKFSTTIWNLVIEKMERRLVRWKCFYLFKGGVLPAFRPQITHDGLSSLSSCSGGRINHHSHGLWAHTQGAFPDLFSIAAYKDAAAANLMSVRNGKLHWEVQDLIACWPGALGCSRHAVIWRAIPHCLMWCIWQERNLWSFERREMTSPDLKSPFFRMLFD
uniref:Reverse transcriptase domain-containing protein n=1 Tax=Fagus sylvatica TaxID=28930 RepID=A0A2N9GXM3_FAGSY